MAIPAWWGSRAHVVFTVVVFVILASLDNAAVTLIPAMVLPVAEALNTSEQAIGISTGIVILVVAVSAAGWGYYGDRSSRKRLLFWGTIVWALGAFLTSTSSTFAQLLVFQIVTGLGLGSIASVGFSVISDFIAPHRRGLAMSFWGLSQGIGGLCGGLLGSQLGADDFRTPLLVIAVLGLAFALLYIATFDAPRGYSQPELEELLDSGIDYDYRIELEHIPTLWHRETNRWLILQGLFAQIAYGSLIWVPLLYQEKVIEAGYDVATATRVGGILGSIFQIGGLFSILAGHIGDRLQAKNKSARAIVSSIGILGAIPFFILFFFVPLKGLDVTPGASTGQLIPEVLGELVTNPWVTLAFFASLAALAFTGADSPNWFALISDVNLPEHRGTIFGLGNLANGIGRSTGNVTVGALAGTIDRALPPPLNWAVGLTIFQVFFLPTGYMYARAARSSPGDIDEVHEILQARGGH